MYVFIEREIAHNAQRSSRHGSRGLQLVRAAFSVSRWKGEVQSCFVLKKLVSDNLNLPFYLPSLSNVCGTDLLNPVTL
jgi:hypothetical protein